MTIQEAISLATKYWSSFWNKFHHWDEWWHVALMARTWWVPNLNQSSEWRHWIPRSNNPTLGWNTSPEEYPPRLIYSVFCASAVQISLQHSLAQCGLATYFRKRTNIRKYIAYPHWDPQSLPCFNRFQLVPITSVSLVPSDFIVAKQALRVNQTTCIRNN